MIRYAFRPKNKTKQHLGYYRVSQKSKIRHRYYVHYLLRNNYLENVRESSVKITKLKASVFLKNN